MNLKTRQLEALRKHKEAMAVADDFHLDQFFVEAPTPSRLQRIAAWTSLLASATTITFSIAYLVVYATIERHNFQLLLSAWLAYCGLKDIRGNWRSVFRSDP